MSSPSKGKIFTSTRFKVKSKMRWIFSSDEKINDNAYQIDLEGKYDVSATFNVSYLTSFDANNELDSRINLSKGRENDLNQDDLVLPPGQITCTKAKKLQLTLNYHVEEEVNSIKEIQAAAIGQKLYK